LCQILQHRKFASFRRVREDTSIAAARETRCLKPSSQRVFNSFVSDAFGSFQKALFIGSVQSGSPLIDEDFDSPPTTESSSRRKMFLPPVLRV
jgi:hypothetical protein